MTANIILIDDDQGIQFSFKRYLNAAGYDIKSAQSINEARKAFSATEFDIALLDVKLPDGNGLELVSELREKNPSISIVIITGHGNISLAVEAMKMGADNFLTKPVNMGNLAVYLQKSVELMDLRRGKQTLQRIKTEAQPFFGKSPAMKKVKKIAESAFLNDSSVILIGETGTGKEVMAKWIHNNSLRKDRAFVEVNCAGLKDELLTSELFGHTRGAFTSAVKDREGLIEAANGGVLFLDEIASMNLNIQAQLLKVIEEKKFRRLGETKVRTSDFRLICATNKDLIQEVREGRFRNDLYYRINIFPVYLPPLRDIKDNLPQLISHLLDELKYMHPYLPKEAIKLLTNYDWPGNIRELKNVLERAIILSDGGPLSATHFPGLNSSLTHPVQKIKKLDDYESEYINYIVDYYNRDTKKAAEALGISRASLYRKLDKSKTDKSKN